MDKLNIQMYAAVGEPHKHHYYKRWLQSKVGALADKSELTTDEEKQLSDLKSEFLQAVANHQFRQLESIRMQIAVANEEKDTKTWKPLALKAIETIKTQRSFMRLPFLKPLFAAAPKTKKFIDLKKKIAQIKKEVNQAELAAQKKRTWAKKAMAQAFIDSV